MYESLKQRSGLDRAGYNSNVEFNRALRSAENTLLAFNLKRFGSPDPMVDAALRPFIVEKKYFTPADIKLPADLHTILRLQEDGQMAPIYPIRVDAAASTLQSPIRSKVRSYYIANGEAILVPSASGVVVTLSYIRHPKYGSRAVTVGAEDVEVYDQNGSVDLEWDQVFEEDLLSLLLFIKGIEVKNNELVQFARAQTAQ